MLTRYLAAVGSLALTVSAQGNVAVVPGFPVNRMVVFTVPLRTFATDSVAREASADAPPVAAPPPEQPASIAARSAAAENRAGWKDRIPCITLEDLRTRSNAGSVKTDRLRGDLNTG
jgi:hypothetical protein